MKKRITMLVLLVFTVALVGCTPEQVAFWEKNNEVSQWEATELDTEMSFTMTNEVETQTIMMHLDGFVNTQDMSGILKMSISDPTGVSILKDHEMILKDGKTYLHRDFIEQMEVIAGEPFLESVIDADTEYLLFEQPVEQQAMIDAMIANPEIQEEILTFYEEMAKAMGLDIPVTKEENTYRITLNETQFLEIIRKCIIEGTNQLPVINELFGIGMTEEDILKIQEEMKIIEPDINDTIALFEQLVGCELQIDHTFEENAYTQAINMTFSGKEGVFSGSEVSLTMQSTAKKSAVIPVTITGKVQTITQEDLLGATMGTNGTQGVIYDIETGTLTNGNNQAIAVGNLMRDQGMLIECKILLAQFDEEVVYDTVSKQVGIQTEVFTPIQTTTIDGVSYISIQELQRLGFVVTAVENEMHIERQ